MAFYWRICMNRKIAVIGVGNMAKAIIDGMLSCDIPVERFYIYDKFPEACAAYKSDERFCLSDSISAAVSEADCVLLSVKPQNFPEVLAEIKALPSSCEKLYITIAAGITSRSVSDALGGAVVIRVLPNLPMTIGKGVSAICTNAAASENDFNFVKSVFSSAGNTLIIDESQMNRIIGVTSSSPAYVFKFIDAICKGAKAQGIDENELLDAVCDMVIGSALLLKGSADSPATLISKVASKGGTTERALAALDAGDFDKTIENAMKACTLRADELGK